MHRRNIIAWSLRRGQDQMHQHDTSMKTTPTRCHQLGVTINRRQQPVNKPQNLPLHSFLYFLETLSASYRNDYIVEYDGQGLLGGHEGSLLIKHAWGNMIHDDDPTYVSEEDVPMQQRHGCRRQARRTAGAIA
ncbi:hypothetical protein L2E82_25834 [Cichorium intybus]|uniref:Uncharacterized protein n=1 Tax=Cichorium intybus TaxID=13427 RepID=A0ACB9E4R9_CICIN|nr:hypothetical protein L2E82_25834 [Cichorium intybus]